MRLHELGLNFHNVFKILGLAKFLDERKRSSDVLCRIAQEYLVLTPRQRLPWTFATNQNNPEFVSPSALQ